MTTSADGTSLAVNVRGCQPDHFQTWFICLPTAQITRWDSPDGAGSLSLTADGSVLGLALDEDIDDPAPPQAWTMPTDTPAGPMLKRAHKVPGLGANVDRVILSPSGDQMWIEAQIQPDAPVTLSLATTSTGALNRKIAGLSPDGNDAGFSALALDAAAQHMLAYGFPSGPGFADVNAIDLISGKTFSHTITTPIIDGPLTTFAW